MLLLALQPAAALAQECIGFASLEDFRYRVASGYANYRYANGYHASVTAGKPIHATATFEWVNDAEINASSYRTTLDARVGWSLLHDAVSVCPVAGLTYATVPFRTLRYGQGMGFRDISLAAGLNAAVRVPVTDRLSVLPTASVRAVSMWGRATSSCGWDKCHSSGREVYWVIGGGLGIVANDRITIRPGVTVPLDFPPVPRSEWLVPFGREENEIALELGVGFNFGRRGR